MSIVVPDALWPAEFGEMGFVASAKDVKVQSGWIDARQRARAPTQLEQAGIFTATEIYAPGSLVAVSTVEQALLDGDFDGDQVSVIGGRNALYAAVSAFDAAQAAAGRTAFKPPKAHTSSFDEENRYRPGRADLLVSALSELMESFSGLQLSVLGQSPANQ